MHSVSCFETDSLPTDSLKASVHCVRTTMPEETSVTDVEN